MTIKSKPFIIKASIGVLLVCVYIFMFLKIVFPVQKIYLGPIIVPNLLDEVVPEATLQKANSYSYDELQKAVTEWQTTTRYRKDREDFYIGINSLKKDPIFKSYFDCIDTKCNNFIRTHLKSETDIDSVIEARNNKKITKLHILGYAIYKWLKIDKIQNTSIEDYVINQKNSVLYITNKSNETKIQNNVFNESRNEWTYDAYGVYPALLISNYYELLKLSNTDINTATLKFL